MRCLNIPYQQQQDKKVACSWAVNWLILIVCPPQHEIHDRILLYMDKLSNGSFENEEGVFTFLKL